jgi:drug/metabolite transporter (DMT)-like permease
MWAEFAVLGAALSYALSAIFARRIQSMDMKPIDIAAGQMTAATVILPPFALVIDKPWLLPPPSVAVIASVLAIAVFSTALAYVVYFRILAGAGATNVLLVTLLVPATSVILGALFLNERLLTRQFLGFALIAIGLAFIDGRLPRAMFAARSNPNLAARDSRLPIGPKSR